MTFLYCTDGLTDESADSDESWPDASEPDLCVVIDLCSADDFYPEGVLVVAEESNGESIGHVVNCEAE